MDYFRDTRDFYAVGLSITAENFRAVSIRKYDRMRKLKLSEELERFCEGVERHVEGPLGDFIDAAVDYGIKKGILKEGQDPEPSRLESKVDDGKVTYITQWLVRNRGKKARKNANSNN